MKAFKHTIPALLLILLSACGSTKTFHTDATSDADGTLVIREQGALRLASGGAGRGTLTLHGWEYPFELSNMALSGVGPEDLQLEGDVYNINEASDFEGTFRITATEIQAGQGAQGFWAENEKGVRIHAWAEGQDVTVRLNTDGATARLTD